MLGLRDLGFQGFGFLGSGFGFRGSGFEGLGFGVLLGLGVEGSGPLNPKPKSPKPNQRSDSRTYRYRPNSKSLLRGSEDLVRVPLRVLFRIPLRLSGGGSIVQAWGLGFRVDEST